MVYEDDGMCAQCGGIRVAKSTLCADCLVVSMGACVNDLDKLADQVEIEAARASVIISDKNEEIERLKYQLRLQRRLLRHIFREYQVLQKIKAVDVLA